MLCYRCNTGIGQLRDSIELLESSISYLKEPPAEKLRMALSRTA
jgi:hypothetical protein